MTNATPLAALEPFRAAIADPHRTAREWKAAGGKVVGVRCLYVPEELVWAAGMLPEPLYGTPEPVRLADAYFQSCTCEFVRNLFDHALDGRLAHLDLLALSNTCDVARRLFDMWERYVPGVPVYLLNNPQKMEPEENREYFGEELRRFQARVEQVAGKAIGDAELRGAIALYDETRELLRRLYALRVEDPPRLSGTEAFTAAMGASLLPKDRANELLRALLAEVGQREAPDVFGPRLLVTGSLLDSPALLAMVEEVGGVVVADDFCTTSRWFWNRVGSSGEPLAALVEFLNRRPQCACMHPPQARFDHVLGLIDEFRVDAVLQLNLKYCHPFAFDTPLIKRRLDERKLPFSVLEVGHDGSGFGQLRTRIQAFVEMVDAG
jgi:benzoyl-CoA reductase subunit C